ncbi:hypothetical protein M0638_28525 [Roseomonas sp. NAR14]|uniref:Uncharacterized protein n=1 Tax=Roseomonas acroporae TaxID=2937791 RepID=A0A9X1YED0_9PROT|nr:hypothetical protein [Roseomonas acroporae]MCK8788302.1 hypothetical protein [Roseomonas acroporae]
MHAVADNFTTTVSERLADALRRRWGVFRSPAKMLARAIGHDPRACQNWLSANNAPHLAHVIELMADDPHVEEVILDLVRDRRAARGKSHADDHA